MTAIETIYEPVTVDCDGERCEGCGQILAGSAVMPVIRYDDGDSMPLGYLFCDKGCAEIESVADRGAW